MFTLQLYNPAMLNAAYKLSKRKRSLRLHQGTVEVMHKTFIRKIVVLLASFSIPFKIFQHSETDVSGTQLPGTETQTT